MKKFLIAAAVLLPLFAHAEEAFDKNTYKRLAAECGKNNLESCVKFAIWTRDDLESPADAYAPLKKACDGGHMKGCNVLGNLYLDPTAAWAKTETKPVRCTKKPVGAAMRTPVPIWKN